MSDAHAQAPELTERVEPTLGEAQAADHAHAAAAVSAVIQDEGFFSVGEHRQALSEIPAQAVVDAVLRWHNRHPLAVRLMPADIGGIGRVQLPFEPPLMTASKPAKGWKRWLKRAKGPQPAFEDEALLPGVSLGRLTRFAWDKATLERPGAPEWPTRPLRATHPKAQPLYLLTAAFQVDGQARRVALSPGVPMAVLGSRRWSRLRLAILFGAALAASLVTWGGMAAYKALTAPSAHEPAKAKGKKAAAAASAASAHEAGHGEAAKPAHGAHGDAHAEGHGTAAGHAEGAASAASGAEAHAGSASGAAQGHEASASAAAQADAGHAEGHGAAEPAKGEGAAAADKTEGVAKAPPTVTYALISAPTWRPAELQAMQREISKILGHRLGGMHSDVMRTPEGEVLALGPLPTQAAADELAARLGRYGVMMVPITY